MSVPVPLRNDFDAAAVRLAAKASKNAAQTRRQLALADIYDGGTRNDAARVGGVGLQAVRDWVLAFNAKGPTGLIDGKVPGQLSKLNAAQRQALVRLVESGPMLRSMAWCAGGCAISPGGCLRSSASAWTTPRSGASCASWTPPKTSPVWHVM